MAMYGRTLSALTDSIDTYSAVLRQVVNRTETPEKPRLANYLPPLTLKKTFPQ
jgi:hypothetical protein